MNTMTTYSGRKFDPMQMTPGDVYIEDIAHALSLLCRGGGQLTYFYSVGQHSLNCAAEAKARGWSKRQQLACLLHDASEGYISDIIRPVKIYLTNYLEIESKIMGTILTHFGLDDLTEEENRRWKQTEGAASWGRRQSGAAAFFRAGSGGAYAGRGRSQVPAGGRATGGARQ